jgi:hypothetical protein
MEYSNQSFNVIQKLNFEGFLPTFEYFVAIPITVLAIFVFIGGIYVHKAVLRLLKRIEDRYINGII